MLHFTTKPGVNPAPQTFNVINGDTFGSTLNFTAAVATAGTWASLNPGTGKTLGSVGQPITVSVAVGAMGIGEYDTSITVTGMNTMPATVTLPVHLSVTASGIVPDAGSDASSGPDGGPAGTGGAMGAGGGSGSGGSVNTGGAAGSVGPAGTTTGGRGPSGEDSGCGCRVGGGTSGGRALFVAALAVLASLRRRSERRRTR